MRGRSRGLLLTAACLAALGVLAIVSAYVWAAASASPPPLVLYLLSMLLPVGMVVAGIAVARDYRSSADRR